MDKWEAVASEACASSLLRCAFHGDFFADEVDAEEMARHCVGV